MRLQPMLLLMGVMLVDTVAVFNNLGLEHCRTSVQNWIHKTDLQASEVQSKSGSG